MKYSAFRVASIGSGMLTEITNRPLSSVIEWVYEPVLAAISDGSMKEIAMALAEMTDEDILHKIKETYSYVYPKNHNYEYFSEPQIYCVKGSLMKRVEFTDEMVIKYIHSFIEWQLSH